MKREIKFRGQKTQTKEWVLGSLVSTKEHGYAIIQQRENPIHDGVVQGWCFGVIPETVGQFTGLHDKNGKEIYDGDIISDEFLDTYEGLQISRETVFFDVKLGTWMLDQSYSQDESYASALATNLMEYEYTVVGNIYETPQQSDTMS